MTTNELINHLQKLPPDLPVMVRGYEDGYNAISELKLKTLKPHPGQDKEYYGEFADAAAGSQHGFKAVELFGINLKAK